MERKLEIKSLELKVGSGRESRVIFSGIDAVAEKAQFIALVGANGKGKSTLLKTISGILPKYGNGEILFAGRPLEEYPTREKSEIFSFVGAGSPRAKNLSVRGLMSINRYYKTNWLGTIKEEDRQKISKALEMVSLSGFEECIILDEPTAFLDIANRFLVTKLLRDIAHKSGRCVIFSTHDLQSALQMCDRIWVMAGDGFYDDTPGRLMEHDVFNRIFDRQEIVFNKVTRSFETTDDI